MGKQKIIVTLLIMIMMASYAFGVELSESSDVTYIFGYIQQKCEGGGLTEPVLVGIVIVYHLAEEDEWFKKLLEFVSITDEYYPEEECSHWYCMDKGVFEELNRKVKGIRPPISLGDLEQLYLDLEEERKGFQL